MSGQQVLVIIPCYNEEKRLRLDPFSAFLRARQDYGFLFVDDGSKDGTLKVLQSLKAESPDRVEILRLEKNCGKAEAVRRGFLRGTRTDAPYLAYWDADLATPLDVIPLFTDIFQKKRQVEVVLGSRVKLLGHDIRRNEVRHYLGRVFATFASAVLGLSVYDTQCGAKMFRNTPLLAELFNTPFLSRWIFDVELIARYLMIKKQKGKEKPSELLHEIPLPSWHDISGSKLRPLDFVRAFFELLRIKLRYF